MIMTGGLAVRAVARSAGSKVALTCLVFAATAVMGLTAFFGLSSEAEAKTPGSTYCYYGKCHRVKTLAETERLVGSKETLHTSFYDDCKKDSLNPCGLTSSGEVFRPHMADNAASPIYPDGTVLLVWSPVSKQAAVLRVNNAGPYWGNRKLDVSRAVAEVLGFKSRGVAKLQVQVLDAPNSQQATYKRRRRYQAVPGPIGTYGSLEEARISIAVMESLDNMTVTAVAANGPALSAQIDDVSDDGLVELAAANAQAVSLSLFAPVKTGTVLGRIQAKSQRIAQVHRAATQQLAVAEQAKREQHKLAEKRLEAKSLRIARIHSLAEAQQVATVAVQQAEAEAERIAQLETRKAEAQRVAQLEEQQAAEAKAKARRLAIAKRKALQAKRRYAVRKKKAAAKRRAVAAKRSKSRSRRSTASRRANRKQRYATQQRSTRRARRQQAAKRGRSYEWNAARTRLHSRPLARYGAPRKTRHSRKRGYWRVSEAQIGPSGQRLIGVGGSSLFDEVPDGARRQEPSPADQFPANGPVQVV